MSKRNKAARIALKVNDQYPGSDFRSEECVTCPKQADASNADAWKA